MARPLRFIPNEYLAWTDSYDRPIAVVEVTIRTILGMFLLTPTPKNKDLIVGVMAHVQERLKFDLYGYAWLSNHGSYLMGVTGPEHLAAIMREMHGQIAREIGRPECSDWSGAFWGRRGRAILVADEAVQLERLKYCLANSTKEHLVTRPTRWPGAHAAHAVCGSMVDTGIWIDRTRLDTMQRQKGSDYRRCLEACTDVVTLKLSKLPCLAHLTDFEYNQAMKALCREISEEATIERKATGASVTGIKRLLRYSAHHKPDGIDKTPAPAVHCGCHAIRAAFKAAYGDFVNAYREASGELGKTVLTALFPTGGLPPGYCFEPS